MDWRQAIDSIKTYVSALQGGNLTIGLVIVAVGILAVLAITFIDRQHWTSGRLFRTRPPKKLAEPKASPSPDQATAAQISVRQKLGTKAEPADEDVLSLEGTALAPIDRFFPSEPKSFIVFVLCLVVGAWLIGLALAPDRMKFFASAEWRFMPLYLAAHLIAVRLFITAFTRNFRAGVKHLDVPTARVLKGVRGVLGPAGLVAAFLVAMPFCYFDYLNIQGSQSRYDRMGPDNAAALVDLWMWCTWCLEWFLNALIWVMLVSFLIKNVSIIRNAPFRSPIELVVHERHYQPFLQMSTQGATIVLGFSAITIFYLWYTGGELTDYAGLAITAVLLVVGFVPPWVMLRRKVRKSVETETLALRNSIAQAMWRDAKARKEGAASSDKVPLEQRLGEALTIFRISHLEQLKLNLGRREARAILFRLLPPAAGVVWQVSQGLPAIVGKIEGTWKSIQALVSRWVM